MTASLKRHVGVCIYISAASRGAAASYTLSRAAWPRSESHKNNRLQVADGFLLIVRQ